MSSNRVKRLTMRTTAAHANLRLDAVLADWLPGALGAPVSKAKARKLIVAGAIYLNGKRVRIASKTLIPNAKLEAFIDETRLADSVSRDVIFSLTSEKILYEDEWLIAVNKPSGLPTQPTLDDARENLFATLKRYLKDSYVGLHHRLDRDTSGVVLFTKKQAANAGTADLFSKHLAQKTYHAFARGSAPLAEWTVKNYLGKKSAGKRARFGAVKGGDFAHTDFKRLEQLKGAFLLEAMPRTGRTHQIRVHLAEAGNPILGDSFYGDEPPGAPRVMLHALCLEFPHPMTGAKVRIESPVPQDFRELYSRLGGK